jgi:hypothetical protein
MSRLSRQARLLWRNSADGPGLYVLRNLENGLIYIGMTERPIPERIAEHCKRPSKGLRELFKGQGRVEVTSDVIIDACPVKMLHKEYEVGHRLNAKYPGRLVNKLSMLGRSVNHSIHKQSTNTNTTGESGVSLHSQTTEQMTNSSNKRPLVAINPNGTWTRYRGVREAAADLGLDNSTVSKVLNGLRPHHEGFYFIDMPVTFNS